MGERSKFVIEAAWELHDLAGSWPEPAELITALDAMASAITTRKDVA